MAMNQEQLKRDIIRWRTDIVGFVREVFNPKDEIEPWQCKGLESFRDNPKTALRAAKGVGKSCVLSWCAWWFLITRPHGQVYCTSINALNLKNGLSKEIRYWYLQAPEWFQDLFDVKDMRIADKSNMRTHFIQNVTWSKDADSAAQAESMTGIHADNVCWVLDETGTYPVSTIQAAEAIFSSPKFARIIIAGNCNNTQGAMYFCTENQVAKQNWHTISITSDPEDPNRSKRVSKKWAQELIDTFGRTHPYVQVNVLSQFPTISLIALLSRAQLEEASKRPIDESLINCYTPHIGIDVARQGGDTTVVVGRQGNKAFPALRVDQALFRGRDIVTATRGYIDTHFGQFQKVKIFCDGTGGWGSSVVDVFNDLNIPVRSVAFNERADDHDRFVNKRAEMYMRFRDWVANKGHLPYSEILTQELTAIQYFQPSGGSRTQMMAKDLLKAEIHRSPDEGDANALTHTELDTYQGDFKIQEYPWETSNKEYDPLDPDLIGVQ